VGRNDRLAATSDPPLTAVHIDAAQAVRPAVDLLPGRCFGRRVAAKVDAHPHLVVRASTAAPSVGSNWSMPLGNAAGIVDMPIDMPAQSIDWKHLAEVGRTFSEQLPPEWGLGAVWPPVILLVVSAIIGLHGERLTRVLVIGTFIALAALLGQRLAEAMALAFWPTVVLCGALGGIIAYVFYRWSLGLVLAAVMAAAAGAWSASCSLNTDEVLAILRGAAGPSGGRPVPVAVAQAGDYLHYVKIVYERAAHLWSAVAAQPGAGQRLLLTMCAGGAVGLLAGLVFGRIAAILWTSVLAAAGIVFAAVCLALWYEPKWSQYLSDNHQYLLFGGIVAAALFALRQLGRRRPTVIVATVPADSTQPQNNS
jgi:hypothetical protein